MSLPFLTFSLAARGQLQLGSTDDSYIRIFLIQEQDSEGVGVELGRQATGQPLCGQVSVRYFMWVGHAENVTFCQCGDAATGQMLSASPGACSPE